MLWFGRWGLGSHQTHRWLDHLYTSSNWYRHIFNWLLLGRGLNIVELFFSWCTKFEFCLYTWCLVRSWMILPEAGSPLGLVTIRTINSWFTFRLSVLGFLISCSKHPFCHNAISSLISYLIFSWTAWFYNPDNQRFWELVCGCWQELTIVCFSTNKKVNTHFKSMRLGWCSCFVLSPISLLPKWCSLWCALDQSTIAAAFGCSHSDCFSYIQKCFQTMPWYLVWWRDGRYREANEYTPGF